MNDIPLSKNKSSGHRAKLRKLLQLHLHKLFEICYMCKKANSQVQNKQVFKHFEKLLNGGGGGGVGVK